MRSICYALMLIIRFQRVTDDYVSYKNRQRDLSGVVILHHITKHPKVPDCKADELWEDLKAKKYYMMVY